MLLLLNLLKRMHPAYGWIIYGRTPTATTATRLGARSPAKYPMRSAASSRRAPFTAPALGRLRLRPPEPPSPPDTQSTQSSAGTDHASLNQRPRRVHVSGLRAGVSGSAPPRPAYLLAAAAAPTDLHEGVDSLRPPASAARSAPSSARPSRRDPWCLTRSQSHLHSTRVREDEWSQQRAVRALYACCRRRLRRRRSLRRRRGRRQRLLRKSRAAVT